MPRKQIKTVRMERQAHKDAMSRLQMAYQKLVEAATQASQESENVKKPESTIEEVNSCQEEQPYMLVSPPLIKRKKPQSIAK